ncbi:HAD family hydrolase [Clostridium sp. BJN0001]|uniref:HAD family hydrolase n=1 Tax=Clostridium sp. BJN0001 TaxID=2930219 RepID=UPI001FD363BF|nr:HAD family hydrolase [Clostridium sp. BJN0001]
MIKLIATDMDGTLLNEKSKLPDNFMLVFNKVLEKNITFIAASGRPLYSLQAIFGPMSSKISYICENGALCILNGETIYKGTIDKTLLKDFIKEARKDSDNCILVCTPECAYAENNTDEAHLNEIKKYYPLITFTDNIENIDDVIKVTICNLNKTHNLTDSSFKDKLHISPSGECWTDVTNLDANKGICLQKIMEKLNTSKEEAMVFGDYYNDIPMLNLADYSFVMKNAPEDMKNDAKYIAESNIDEGVFKAILEYAI